MKPAEARERRKAATAAAEFNADERASTRERAAVVIGGVTFTRRRKDWEISRIMRQAMREQEKALAKGNRVRSRVSEHEVKQLEAASDGDDELEAELEEKIDALIKAADDALEAAELETYRLLALLLIPPAEGYGEDNTPLIGFGPEAAAEDEAAVEQALEFLQQRLDVEDARDLANELTGDRSADPPMTPSSETGST